MGRIFKDPSKIDLRSSEGKRNFLGAIQYYFNKVTALSTVDNAALANHPEIRKIQAAVRRYTTASDFPTPVTGSDPARVIEAFHEVADIDIGFEQIFDIKDFSTSKVSGFDVFTVGSGLTFGLVNPGDKAKVFDITGTKVQTQFERFGGGLNFDRTWFDDEQWWNIEDQAMEFRNTWSSERAQRFYDLISASRADSDVAWQGVAADTNASRDAQTINFAAAAIIDSLKDSGLDVATNSQFIVLTPIAQVARVNAAIRMSANFGSIANQQIEFNVVSISTNKLKNFAGSAALTDQYFVCLPKRKAKGGFRQNLTIFSEFDILAYADTVAGWGRDAGIIGDVDQFRRCATS